MTTTELVRAVVERRLGGVNDVEGKWMVRCPGMHCHTHPSGFKDCAVYLHEDGRFPHVVLHCVHDSCEDLVRETQELTNQAIEDALRHGGYEVRPLTEAERMERQKAAQLNATRQRLQAMAERSLPNIIQNSIEGSVAAWRLLQKGMLRGYDQYYMIGLFTSSPYTFHTNYKVTKAADLKGKKIRAVGTISTESIKALGAVPEGMPFPQLPEAISRGVIDGTTGHPIAVFDFGVHRVTSSHYLGRIGTVTADLSPCRESARATCRLRFPVPCLGWSGARRSLPPFLPPSPWWPGA